MRNHILPEDDCPMPLAKSRSAFVRQPVLSVAVALVGAALLLAGCAGSGDGPKENGGDVAVLLGPLSGSEPMRAAAHRAALDDLQLTAARERESAGDFSTAFRGYQAAAEAGNPIARYLLAGLYDRGAGVAVDHAEAARQLQRAGVAGYAPAQAALGMKYLAGEGVWVSSNMAFMWLHLAAEQGNDMAAAHFGLAMLDGKEFSTRPEVIATRDLLLHCAAPDPATGDQAAADPDAGGPSCQAVLGLMYEQGIGVSTDMKQALTWYNRAAARHMPIAEDRLATCYADGNGVSRDLAQANFWRQRYEADRRRKPDSWTPL